jgi:hypothetical protein
MSFAFRGRAMMSVAGPCRRTVLITVLFFPVLFFLWAFGLMRLGFVFLLGFAVFAIVFFRTVVLFWTMVLGGF